jgi:hypothetical protein
MNFLLSICSHHLTIILLSICYKFLTIRMFQSRGNLNPFQLSNNHSFVNMFIVHSKSPGMSTNLLLAYSDHLTTSFCQLFLPYYNYPSVDIFCHLSTIILHVNLLYTYQHDNLLSFSLFCLFIYHAAGTVIYSECQKTKRITIHSFRLSTILVSINFDHVTISPAVDLF